MALYFFGGEEDREDYYYITMYLTGTSNYPEFLTKKAMCVEPIKKVHVKRAFQDGFHKAGFALFDISSDLSLSNNVVVLESEAETLIDGVQGAGFWLANYENVIHRERYHGRERLKVPFTFDEIVDQSSFIVDFNGFPASKGKVGESVLEMLQEHAYKIKFQIRGIIRWKADNVIQLDLRVTEILM